MSDNDCKPKLNPKMDLLIATNNQHKVSEIEAIIPAGINLVTLAKAGITEDIPETGVTLSENALIKAEYAFAKTGMWCFADDTGLEVDALNGQPGVYSARYAGEGKNSIENMNLLLQNLKGIKDRTARFKTVIALIMNSNRYLFEGVVEGRIIETPMGAAGFGYDPIFVPNGYTDTFAQMSLALKNSMSHRSRATHKLIEFIKTLSIAK